MWFVLARNVRSTSAAAVYPVPTWQTVDADELAHWSRDDLAAIRARVEQLPNVSFMIIVGGRVLLQIGDVSAVSYLASARKSVLSMLFGKYVADGTIQLDKSLADLGIDDVGGLTADEKQATIRDLLGARSGVYHQAGNAGDDLAEAPPRGSQRHGRYFLYSNWDFNVLGTIFEQETKRNLYDALETELARPLGMEDFNRNLQTKVNTNPTGSSHPAYHMNLSTRDMARLGYLMLRQGVWRGQQLIPRSWIGESTKPVTRVWEMNPAKRRSGRFGFGYLWWIFDGAHASGAYRGAYMARGALGQHITILPALDMVVVHKTRPGTDLLPKDGVTYPSVSVDEYLQVLDMIVRAHR